MPFREKTFAVFVFANFVFAFGTFIPYDFLILQAQAQGMGDELAGYLVPILNAGRCVRFLPLSDCGSYCFDPCFPHHYMPRLTLRIK